MARGRPCRSEVRDRIFQILARLQKAYGYEVFKEYKKEFPKATMRIIYYHLNKGVDLGIFKIDEIKIEKGNYSWGNEAKKIYYSIKT